MLKAKVNLMALDVGEKRIGIAIGDNQVKIALPYDTIENNDTCIEVIHNIMTDQNVNIIVVGYPRNQSGEPTQQTKSVEDFCQKLHQKGIETVFQDESLTSVVAEDRLKIQSDNYSKSEIDSQAASIILQDYIEANYA